jgi:hypothetical protein
LEWKGAKAGSFFGGELPEKKNQIHLIFVFENVDFRVFRFVLEKFPERGLQPAEFGRLKPVLQFQDGFLAVSFFKLPAGAPVEAS